MEELSGIYYKVLLIIIAVCAFVFYFSDRQLAYYFDNVLAHKVLPVDFKLTRYTPHFDEEERERYHQQKFYFIENAGFHNHVLQSCLDSSNRSVDYKFLEYCIDADKVILSVVSIQRNRVYLVMEQDGQYKVKSTCVNDYQIKDLECYHISQYRDGKWILNSREVQFKFVHTIGFTGILVVLWILFLKASYNLRSRMPILFLGLQVISASLFIITILLWMFGVRGLYMIAGSFIYR